MSFSFIGAIMIALASDAAGPTSPWVYHPAGRPLVVNLPSPAAPLAPDEAGSAAGLVLLDAYGGVLAGPIDVTTAQVELGGEMPDIWRLRRAAYLQLLHDGRPIGSALVLQPMLSRMVPVTEEAINPNGIRYTRIARWYDETHPERAEAPGGAGEPDETGHVDRGHLEAAPEPWLAPSAGDGERLMSGLRVYPDRDVVLETTLGRIRLALRPDEAPNTAWNFLVLCRDGFYRDIPFHRVVPMTRNGEPFVIQAGDPTPTGSGGPGYWLPIEPSRLPHDFGVISMARDVDPDSAGSQIFICLSRAGTARLDGHYCSFGYAVDGADTILAIAGVELADVEAGRPVTPPLIVGATLVPAPPRTPHAGRPDDRVQPPLDAPETGPTRVPR